VTIVVVVSVVADVSVVVSVVVVVSDWPLLLSVVVVVSVIVGGVTTRSSSPGLLPSRLSPRPEPEPSPDVPPPSSLSRSAPSSAFPLEPEPVVPPPDEGERAPSSPVPEPEASGPRFWPAVGCAAVPFPGPRRSSAAARLRRPLFSDGPLSSPSAPLRFCRWPRPLWPGPDFELPDDEPDLSAAGATAGAAN
jgi:hypothetical protein